MRRGRVPQYYVITFTSLYLPFSRIHTLILTTVMFYIDSSHIVLRMMPLIYKRNKVQWDRSSFNQM